ncbi:MAG TPA: RNA polymerase sigma-54 factor [Thermopetrobacter sp.]|nr:RNA polymerase sigma-54 factor [Thermopetrobacter sp.]
MALRQKLEMRQGQSLVMTPQLQQAIRLLQMSNIELQAFVEAELERNPLLERTDLDEPENRRREPDTAPPGEETPRAVDTPDLDTALGDGGGASQMEALDADADVLYDDTPADLPQPETPAAPRPDMAWQGGGAGRGPAGPADGEGRTLEETVGRVATLAEHLQEQLPLVLSDPPERLIGHYLIGMLDEAGYLREPLTEIAARLGTSVDQVERVLEKMQGLDPPGVFARDLGECLKLQLREQGLLDAPMERLIDHLELLAKRDFAKLARRCGIDREELPQKLALIQRLNPRPGGVIGPLTVQPVVPDVFVRATAEGGWAVELNGETLPKVLVNNQYYATVAASARREEDREYISDCLASANWLVKSLDQRARTILVVSREIVRRQDAFLRQGVDALRPLTLKDVSEAVNMHESTISRVTSNKYMATPRGLFEMKYFFTTAIATSDGDSVSAEAVRHKIRRLIDAETPESVLSDDRIVDILREQGVEIARRTVAKYREAMGIPSSVQRRREKKLLNS